MSFTGGKLKLKGGTDLSAKGGAKKKKRAKPSLAEGAELALAVAGEQPPPQQADGAPDAEAPAQAGGSSAEPPADRRTDAEKRHAEHSARLEAGRVKKAASKSHRERIKELNDRLATLSEHNDIPRISYSYM
jgi:protein FAM32A